jgi:C4-dicarboxylate-specific signal transduction histidine kinase
VCKNAENQPFGAEAKTVAAGIRAVLAGTKDIFQLEYPCHSPTQQRWFYLKVSPMQGVIQGVVISHENITERIHREAADKKHLDELAHVTRLGLMGEMASGLAHEINQPLGAISMYTQASINLIDAGNTDPAKLAAIAAKTQQQALRAGQIIQRMRDFMKSKPKPQASIDINTLINDAVGLCTAEIKRNNIQLSLELENKLPIVLGDHIQIEQVLINLIRNSIDALQGLPEQQARQLNIRSQLTVKHGIQVEVNDNGPGMDSEQQQKILTPFYTSKADGMGMGLSICRSLMEAHGGTLYFQSQAGVGSSFYFTLPVTNHAGKP